MNQIAKEFARLRSEAAKIEARLSEAKVWRKLRLSEFGEMLEAWIQAQLAAAFSRFEAQDLDHAGFRALQAEARLLRRLLAAGHQDESKIESWESRLEGLRADMKRRQTIGLDKDYGPQQPTTEKTS